MATVRQREHIWPSLVGSERQVWDTRGIGVSSRIRRGKSSSTNFSKISQMISTGSWVASKPPLVLWTKSRWVGSCDIWDLTASMPRAGFPFDPGEGTFPSEKWGLLPTGVLEEESKEGRLEGGESNRDAIHAPKASFVLPGPSSALVRWMWWIGIPEDEYDGAGELTTACMTIRVDRRRLGQSLSKGSSKRRVWKPLL